jgi:hypothetical protein
MNSCIIVIMKQLSKQLRYVAVIATLFFAGCQRPVVEPITPHGTYSNVNAKVGSDAGDVHNRIMDSVYVNIIQNELYKSSDFKTILRNYVAVQSGVVKFADPAVVADFYAKLGEIPTKNTVVYVETLHNRFPGNVRLPYMVKMLTFFESNTVEADRIAYFDQVIAQAGSETGYTADLELIASVGLGSSQYWKKNLVLWPNIGGVFSESVAGADLKGAISGALIGGTATWYTGVGAGVGAIIGGGLGAAFASAGAAVKEAE